MTQVRKLTSLKFSHELMGLRRPRTEQRLRVRQLRQSLDLTGVFTQTELECLRTGQLKTNSTKKIAGKRQQNHAFRTHQHVNCSLIKNLQQIVLMDGFRGVKQ